jgi:DNA-binding GntR family transcriptional regulator
MSLNRIASKRNTLGESAYRAIRDEIITLRFEPGQMIYENELATSLGVSRTPIREAFVMLLREELIEVLPQKGARVAYISRKKVEEARFVREALEIGVFKTVAKNWNDQEERYRKIGSDSEQLLKEQQIALTDEDYIKFLHLDEAFHQVMLEQIENHTLLSIVSQMRGHLNRMRYLELKEAHHMSKLVGQHEGILKAMMANDERETESLLRYHLQQTQEELPQIIQKYAHYFRD